MNIRTIFNSSNVSKPLVTFFGYLIALLIGLLEFVIGHDSNLFILYLLPVMLIAWYGVRVDVDLIAFFSAMSWLVVDQLSGHVYSYSVIPLWNALAGLSIFLIIGHCVVTIRDLTTRDRERYLVDNLTGLVNAPSFYEQARIEIARSNRYKRSLTMAYVDLGNLKETAELPERHRNSDDFLHSVVQTLKANLRSTDMVSRLGENKFGIFLPETDVKQAPVVIEKFGEAFLIT